jgi:plastocyanin
MTTTGSRTWLAVAVAVAVALGLALIGLRGEPASAGPTAGASKTASVDIDNFAYSPSTLTITKGSTVSFSNSAGAAHTATRAGAFDTGRIKPGKSASVRFAQKGTFAYHCTIHPFMHGKVIVR